ncbi:PIN domain-containing protein [Rhizobium deserti]|uniref:Ribonuclease VapC n=1 Tax=Rhizobium deserti TaxID=2547961 RepID=A0A4V3API5_9HYPH|nr:type II toxin-antitoxin system VapC family toxin [Rhizobium deserti]TDK37075.1 PIN domain-containing protein [Rhizobium deserti]
MALIVDASVALVWFLPDEESPVADAVLRRLSGERAVVPDLFWHEMRNVLIAACRRQRISRAEVDQSMTRLTQLALDTVSVFDSSLILDLAERHRPTAYDAAYLALAIEAKLPLATLDKRPAEAAAREGVEELR